MAIQVLNEYQQIHTESCIETITLVRYDKMNYDFLAHNEDIRRRLLNIQNKNSLTGKPRKRASDRFIEVKSETDKMYLQYQNEKKEYYYQACRKKNKDNIIKEDIYQAFDDELYKKLFKQNMNIKRRELAERIYVGDENNISRYKNCNHSFLKKKYNVIKLGLGLELCLSDFCRFLWCRGHAFPKSRMDFDLITKYITKKNYIGALKKYKSKFISKRSKNEYEF